MVSKSAEVADASLKYTSQQTTNTPSSTVVCPNNKKYKVTNCECAVDSNNTYTNVVININVEPVLPDTQRALKSDVSDGNIKNRIDDESKSSVYVAFNFYGKCSICSYFVKQNVVLLGNRQATLDINDYFKALMKGNIKGVQLCSDTPLDILTLRERLGKLNNMTSERHYQSVFVNKDENGANERTKDASLLPSTNVSLITKEKGFSTMMITPIKNGEFQNLNVDEIKYISTSDSFQADNVKIGEVITAESMSQIIGLIDAVECANNTIGISQHAGDTSQHAIDTSHHAIDTLEEPIISSNSVSPPDNAAILNSPRNISRSYYECDSVERKRKRSIECGEETTEQSNTTRNDRMTPERQHLLCTSRNLSVDEEKYTLVDVDTDDSSTKGEKECLIAKEEDLSVKLSNLSNAKEIQSHVSADGENDFLLPSGKFGSVIDLLEFPLTGERSLMASSIGYDDDLPHRIQRSRTPSIDSTGDHCRVCHCHGDEVLIAPCHCNGSLKYVHESCLITWMKNPFKDACEICKKKILIVKKRKPIYTWRWPLQRPTPLVWVIVFTTAICVNLMSVVKDATRKCVTTSCIIFYVIGSVGIILASMFLYFWVKRVKVFCESWKVQNEHWVVKIEEEPGKVV